MTINLFIGANNSTGEVETDKIKEVLLQNNLEGFTIVPAQGYWVDNGKVYDENSVLVILDTNKKTLDKILAELKEELQQEAIAHRTAKLQFYAG